MSNKSTKFLKTISEKSDERNSPARNQKANSKSIANIKDNSLAISKTPKALNQTHGYLSVKALLF